MVVVAAVGHGSFGTTLGDSLVAYELKKAKGDREWHLRCVDRAMRCQCVSAMCAAEQTAGACMNTIQRSLESSTFDPEAICWNTK